MTLLLVIGVVGVANPAAAMAEPKDLSQLPDNLRKYVVDSAGWVSSPWMTSHACRDRGGDWSVYVQNVIQDSPDLLAFFQPDLGGPSPQDKPRRDALLAGYRDLATRVAPPPGYCVDDMKQWAGSDPNGKPFGFPWGNDSNHDTDYTCGDSNQLGADLAPCKGFYVSCAGAQADAKMRCESWNQFSDSYVTQVSSMREKVLRDHPAGGTADTHTRVKSPSEIAGELASWVTKRGMEQVTAFVVEGVTKLWGTFLDIAVQYTTPNIQGKGFASVYNLVAGVALTLAFLGFIVTAASSYKRGYLQYSLLGGIKAAVGVTLAGVGAILMLQLADDSTRALAQAGGDFAKQADWTGSLAKVNPLVAVVLGLLICLFLLVAIVFLIAIGPLVLMWALFGSIAAAGQVHPATSGWLTRWASRVTALCWVKFFMVAVMLLVIGLLSPLDGGSDAVRQVVDVVQGFVLAAMLVMTPWLLWELVDFVGDRVGGAASGGGASALAGMAGGRAVGAGGAALSAAGGAAGGAVGTAVSGMMSGVSDIANKLRGSGAGDSGNGDGGGSGSTPPQPEGGSPSGGAGGGGASAEAASGSGQNSASTGSAGSGSSTASPSGPPGQAPQQGGPPPPANRGRVVASRPPSPPTGSSPPSSPSGGAGSGRGPSGSGSTGGGASGSATPPPIPPA
ncbi:hypothetical protein [Longimycelium tulufanense]|uniref:hypothetical protein n=1 Tax=Longimycelium tulufanense TaxID=907463 RepID=UPI001667AD03|nr:hypothetical protein [Longimycelium tulufanense]